MLTKDANGEAYSQNPIARICAMHAIKLSNEIYHLLQRGGHDTVCGLRIGRSSSARKDGLLMLNELPETARVCKHCQRIQEQDRLSE